MNVFDLLFVFVCIAIGWAAGTLAHHHFGMIGFLLAFIIGTLLLPMAIHIHPKLRRRGPYWPWF